MSKITIKKLLGLLLAAAIVASFGGCAKKEEENTTEPQTENTAAVTTTQPETTTEPITDAPTTQPETTTAKPKDGESIQKIIDTLESKHFYMAGAINLKGGQKMDAKVTCDGDNYRMEIVSAQMKMSIIAIDSVPYVVNNATNMYVVIDDAAIDNMDQMLSGLSAFGVSMSNGDIADMKNMMKNFDMNMDFSRYIEGGEYYEHDAAVNGQNYRCSVYKTEYGTIRIYTQDGELKIVDLYDTDGLQQMNFIVAAFIPEVLTPISLNGYTKASSIVNLFTSVGR